jgi:hypothetical protein
MCKSCDFINGGGEPVLEIIFFLQTEIIDSGAAYYNDSETGETRRAKMMAKWREQMANRCEDYTARRTKFYGDPLGEENFISIHRADESKQEECVN